MKRSIATLAATAAVLSMVIAGPAPASAHYAYLYHGKDIATVSEYHWVGTVCDQEKDGHADVAWILMDNNGYESVEDIDGSAGGCTSYTLPSPTHGVAVCEEAVGCTRYYLA